jgi:hypothetical protein
VKEEVGRGRGKNGEQIGIGKRKKGETLSTVGRGNRVEEFHRTWAGGGISRKGIKQVHEEVQQTKEEQVGEGVVGGQK